MIVEIYSGLYRETVDICSTTPENFFKINQEEFSRDYESARGNKERSKVLKKYGLKPVNRNTIYI